jgi:uncharacterized protein with FMN-binding domain
MKKILIILAVLFGMILLIAIAFFFRYRQMARTIDHEQITDIDLTSIEDGIYTGEYGEFLIFVKVTVAVRNRRITKIDIIDQRAGPGYEALETLDRILGKQSPDVDVVSGATSSSKCIMIAVRNALTKP